MTDREATIKLLEDIFGKDSVIVVDEGFDFGPPKSPEIIIRLHNDIEATIRKYHPITVLDVTTVLATLIGASCIPATGNAQAMIYLRNLVNEILDDAVDCLVSPEIAKEYRELKEKKG